MSEKSERLQIIEMVDNGIISATDAALLLRALDGESSQDDSFSAESTTPLDETGEQEQGPLPAAGEETVEKVEGEVIGAEFDRSIARWKRYWTIPLWIGVVIAVLGGMWVFWSYANSGASFWFFCAWVPFLIGVFMIAMAWRSRTAKWLHLRIRQEPGERPQTIAFSFPLPLRFASWFVRTFRRYIPQLDHKGIDEAIIAVADYTSSDTPFYIEVDEGEGQEKVQIYIG
jgi:SHOCT-like domain